MSIDDKAETKAFELCPTKFLGFRRAKMYSLIDVCRCDDCAGYGIYIEDDKLIVCPYYDDLCRKHYNPQVTKH